MKLPLYARLLLWLLAVATLLILYGPPLVTMLLSFFTRKAGAVVWESFSFDWYLRLLGNDKIHDALINSVLVGFISVFLATAFGILFALYADNQRNKFRGLFQFIIFLPFLLPPIITGLSLLIFFQEVGVPRSLATVVIGHTLFVLALVYRTLLTRLQSLSRDLAEASSDLGASRGQTFRFIILPNLSSALAAAAVLAFALSFDETLITLFLVGGESTLPIRLWGMMRVGFTPEINALVTLILALSTLLFLAVARWLRPTRS